MGGWSFYRAYEERLRRPVALKLLPEEMAGQAERRARILGEMPGRALPRPAS